MDAATCKKELVIEIPADVVRQEAETLAVQYARVARIPGFRPGHAPKALVRQRYRADIRSELVQALLPRYFENAVKEQKWMVAGRPQFEDLKFEEDQPLTCKATFEVVPEIELKAYKELEVEEEPAKITDEEVEQALEELRQQAATFEVVSDRPAQDDDYVTVGYQGNDVKTPEAKPVEAREVTIHLGDKNTVAAFSENLRGVKPGDVRQFDVTYPADYPQKALAGKSLSYRVEVGSIKRKVVAPLDDELAKSVSEFSTLQELRNKLREDLTARALRREELATKQKLMDKLVAAHDFPVPDILVDAQLDRKLERIIHQLVAQGIDPRETQVDWRKIREEGRLDAGKDVRAALILEKIADAENLQVTDEEADEVIREMAQEHHEAPAALKTRLTRDGDLDKIKSTRRNQKALDFIYRSAKIIRKSE